MGPSVEALSSKIAIEQRFFLQLVHSCIQATAASCFYYIHIYITNPGYIVEEEQLDGADLTYHPSCK